MPASAHFAIVGAAVALVGCGLAFDYADYQPAAGGASATGPGTGAIGAGGSAGAGGAVPCSDASQCPGTDNECGQRTCIDGECGVDAARSGTLVSGQTSGDCKLRVCDGAGHIVDQPDVDDVEDDGNECTADVCMGTTPAHPAEPANAPCGMGASTHCDGQGNCVGCVGDADCPMDTECANWSCGPGQRCLLTLAGAGTPCGSEQSCAGGVQTNADHCNGLGTCQEAGTMPCAPYVCDANAAACLTSCTSSAQCDAGYFCNLGSNKCQPKKPQGSTCQDDDECAGGLPCVDGHCCENACAGTCMSCNGSKNIGMEDGACLPVVLGFDPDSECSPGTCNGQGACACADGIKNFDESDIDCGGMVCDACGAGKACTVWQECASGYCVDGVCCDSACDALCEACVQSKTGIANGVCGPVIAGTDPDNECPMNCSGADSQCN